MLLPGARKKQSNPLFYVTLLLLIAAGIGSAAYVYAQVDRSGRANILERAATIAEAIPKDDLAALGGNEGDTLLPTYQELKALLMRMRDANHDVRFVYLIGKDADTNLFFFLDSEDPASPDYSPPGQVYYEATPVMREFFLDGVPRTEGPDRDRWGIWISGYAPVRAADGTILAMLGIDLPADRFLSDALIYALLPLLLALVLLTLLIANERVRVRDQAYIDQKAEFLSISSHEIRTPLTGIRWAIEGILSSSAVSLDARTRSVLTLVHESCLSLLGRVNNLLDFTALESRRAVPLKKEPIAIRGFLRDITDSLALSASQRGVTITLDEGIDETDSMDADRQMMHHAFFNLLSNAVKYTRERTNVELSYQKEGKDHVFRVSDHGEGVSEDEQTRIFEGYHRTPEAVKSGQYGTGLGLFLVRKAAELHGGSIAVASMPGKGSTFTLSIPE